jgi:hypothetical protein
MYCTHNRLLSHVENTALKEQAKWRNLILSGRVSGNIYFPKEREAKGEWQRRMEKMKRNLKLCVLI